MQFNAGNNITIVDNTISGGGFGLSINGCNNSLILRNTISNANVNNIDINGEGWPTPSQTDSYGSYGILVEDNYSFNASSDCIAFDTVTQSTISNNYVEGAKRYGIIAGGKTGSNSTIISNNQIYSSWSNGITLSGTNSKIKNNTVDGVLGGGSQDPSADGIFVTDNSTGSIIEENQISNVASDGIQIAPFHNNYITITKNNIENCANQGINCNLGVSYLNITNNTITNVPNNAGIIFAGSNSIIMSNFINRTVTGISANIGSNNSTISSNYISSSSWAGIYVQNNNTVVNNNTVINSIKGMQAWDSFNTTIDNNNFSGCTISLQVVGEGGSRGLYLSISNNLGYNPLGSISNAVYGEFICDGGGSGSFKSGTTYTNWGSPKILDISGGIISTILVNEQLISNSTNYQVVLNPKDTFSVTWTEKPIINISGQ